MNYQQKAKDLAQRLTFSKELHPTTDITVFARETDDYNSFNVVTPNLGVYLCKDGKITIEKELTGFMNDSSIKEFDELENVLSEITDFFYAKRYWEYEGE